MQALALRYVALSQQTKPKLYGKHITIFLIRRKGTYRFVAFYTPGRLSHTLPEPQGISLGCKRSGIFTLHGLFDRYYTSTASRIDDVAERILSLVAMPPHTYDDYMDKTRLMVRGANECSWEMIKNLKTEIESILALSRTIICAATQAHDDVTVDMLVGYNAEDEKKLWMISAYIDAEHQHKC